jgi:hypothetical protein
MRLRAHILAVPALLLVAAGPGTAAAATTTTDPAPQELWQAYPLQPGQGTPSVRLPASSAALRPPAPAAARDPGTTDGGGAPGWLLVVAVGAMTLLLGALAGRRARRPQPAAASVAAAPAVQPEPAAPVAPARAQTAPAPPRPPPAPEPPRPRAAPPEPFAMPTEPRRAPPEPRPAPLQEQPLPAVPEPDPAPLEPLPEPLEPVAGPPIRRFRRVPWPPWSEGLWRCEITHHFGVVHADLRVVAREPGRRRGAEVLRTATHNRPGWGAYVPQGELTDTVRRIGDTLLADGWEPVRSDGDEAPQRFFWPREGRPPLDRLAAQHATDSKDEDGS